MEHSAQSYVPVPRRKVECMSSPQRLLERYVEAKDLTRPYLMEEIYAADAVLTYSIATHAIAFPSRVKGREGITRTLVVDFADRFDRCRTFYVCDSLPPVAGASLRVPWLVLMRERAASSLRIGKGYYVWEFTQSEPLRVTGMHIHIARMDSIADPSGSLLSATQAVLPYPWLKPAALGSAFSALLDTSAALSFLKDFVQPLDGGVASAR